MPVASSLTQQWISRLPPSWSQWCGREFEKPYFRRLLEFLAQEQAKQTVLPPAEEVFAALEQTPLEAVRVLIVGQDPYHDEGQAHGLCFSVRPGVKPPPSLMNIFKELQADIGCPIPDHGCLEDWARQGVLLLNTVLTVRAHQAHSHRDRGWEEFTDAVLRRVNENRQATVFVLWGKPAQRKLSLIDRQRHFVVQSAHPSPLSARRGFLGSKPFSQINDFLMRVKQPPIDWRIGTPREKP